ncbi:hypothetical protein F4818DRAFT_395879 [Hypoxylon cercidicola]|nr:hypothetical protein F4818DRAFT_395879 [Hypoxylon cercidicola]
MSDKPNNAPAPVRPPLGRGRVRALSEHFETLVQSQERSAKRSRREAQDEMSDEDVNDAERKASVEVPKRTTILTGEFRTAYVDRLRDMRQEVDERAQLRHQMGYLSVDDLKRSSRPPRDVSPPTRPSTPTRVWESECPGAPVKANMHAAMRRLSSGSSGDDYNDHLLDRKGNKRNLALKNKSHTDMAHERHQKGDTTPNCPSPLRQTFADAGSDDDDN